ncbi:hypothetical protein XENOCAPTIV_006179, partial [Xenoophorus captivus]
IEESYKVKEPIKAGNWFNDASFEKAMCCTRCEENCHYPGCVLAPSPAFCDVIKGGHCIVCSGKCPTSFHVKEKWRYVTKTKKVQMTLKEMQQNYEKSKTEREKNLTYLESLETSMKHLTAEKSQVLDESYNHVVNLEKIALKVESASTLVQLDFLIEKMKEAGDTKRIPVVTRAYTTACVLTTAAVQLEIITPFQLYFNPDLILRNYQVWRLITNFLFFGPVGFNFLFNMIFLYRYCRMLEEGSFRGRTADFVFMFLFGGLLMTIFGMFVSLVFLGQAFTIMLVYIWSRRNPNIRMNFFGLLNFQAPFLPWVLMGFSLLLGNSIIVDLLGIAVGHVYYFLEDVFPNQPGGGRWLKTPSIIKMLFDTPEEDANYNPLPEDRPGGFAWGEGQRLGG